MRKIVDMQYRKITLKNTVILRYCFSFYCYTLVAYTNPYRST